MVWMLVYHPDDFKAVFTGLRGVSPGYAFEFGGVGAVLLNPGRDGSWQTLEFEFLADQMLCAETG